MRILFIKATMDFWKTDLPRFARIFAWILVFYRLPIDVFLYDWNIFSWRSYSALGLL